MENNAQQFRNKRQQFATQIRRQNRQQILSKRRNMHIQNQQMNVEKVDKQFSIIDERFCEKIKQFHNNPPCKQKFLQFLTSINDDDIIKKHYGIIGIRKLLTEQKNLVSCIQNVIDAGFVPKLIQFAIQTNFPQLQLQAVWCLANIASGNSQQTASIIEKGGIKIFIDLLQSPHIGIVQKSIWTLGNIACDSPALRDGIVKNGGVKNMIKFVEKAINQLPQHPSMIEIIQTVAWTLSCICRKQPLPNYLNIKECFPVFFYLVKNKLLKDHIILGNVCWAISYFTNRTKHGPTKIDTIQNCIDSGVLPTIIQFLSQDYDVLVATSLKIVGSIANGNEQQCETLLALGVLDKLTCLLDRAKKVYRRDACWAISNITAGCARHIQIIFQRTDLIKRLLQMLKEDLPDVRIQICYIFANATDQGDKQRILSFLTQIKYLECLISILSNQSDTNLLGAALQCLDILLLFGMSFSKDKKSNVFVKQLYSLKFMEKLQQLQFHDDQKIYDQVSRIIENYLQYQDSLNR